MAEHENKDNTSRLLNLVCLIIGFATGLFMVLVAHNAAHGGVTLILHGLLGLVGGYVGTWLLLLAAIVVLSLASGVVLGLALLASLLCFLAVLFALFG